MKGFFLSSLFAKAKLPPQVLDAAIDAYAPRYLGDFIRNEFLGPVARPLVASLLETGGEAAALSVVMLLRTRNPEVLGQLLEHSGLLPDTILLAAVDVWNLSDEDAAKISTHASTTSMANYLPVAAEHINGRPGWGGSTTLRNPPWRPQALPLPNVEHRPTLLTRLGGPFPGQMALVSKILSEDLGDGCSYESLQSWMNFFGLAEPDPAVPLQTVISASKRLTLASL